MKPSEYLAAARDEIEKGWTRGTLENYLGSVCAVGALVRVAKQYQPQDLDAQIDLYWIGNTAATMLERLARELGANTIIGIMGYNDSRRDKQDVLNWFDKAIGQLEERGE